LMGNENLVVQREFDAKGPQSTRPFRNRFKAFRPEVADLGSHEKEASRAVSLSSEADVCLSAVIMSLFAPSGT
jgi:hypothetical protein